MRSGGCGEVGFSLFLCFLFFFLVHSSFLSRGSTIRKLPPFHSTQWKSHHHLQPFSPSWVLPFTCDNLPGAPLNAARSPLMPLCQPLFLTKVAFFLRRCLQSTPCACLAFFPIRNSSLLGRPPCSSSRVSPIFMMRGPSQRFNNYV